MERQERNTEIEPGDRVETFDGRFGTYLGNGKVRLSRKTKKYSTGNIWYAPCEQTIRRLCEQRRIEKPRPRADYNKPPEPYTIPEICIDQDVMALVMED